MPEASRTGGIDPAALSAATLAAAISTIGPPGPYGPIGSMIGLSILVLIIGYDFEPSRTGRQSVAFSAVLGLILLLTFGYLLELCFAEKFRERWDVIFHEPHDDQKYSDVPPWVAILFWFAASAITCGVDRWRVNRQKVTAT